MNKEQLYTASSISDRLHCYREIENLLSLTGNIIAIPGMVLRVISEELPKYDPQNDDAIINKAIEEIRAILIEAATKAKQALQKQFDDL